jgi:hypothetical protein
MPEYLSPGVCVEEVELESLSIYCETAKSQRQKCGPI